MRYLDYYVQAPAPDLTLTKTILCIDCLGLLGQDVQKCVAIWRQLPACLGSAIRTRRTSRTGPSNIYYEHGFGRSCRLPPVQVDLGLSRSWQDTNGWDRAVAASYQTPTGVVSGIQW